ncbi:MAG: hypothetical protein EA422_08555 [Gemmatimonadales bacterium]|nr:MAG: hypothetical protein EA422_08555 [Gemmatimonadales bacterium]
MILAGLRRTGGRAPSRRGVEGELRSLALGEGAAALVFAWLAVKGGVGGGAANRFAISLLVFLLAQGSAWWWARLILLRSWRIAHRSIGLRRTVRALDRVNRILLLSAVPVMIVLSAGWGDLVVGLAFFAFALVEYVNYFHVRLSYGRSGFDLRELWRRPMEPSSIRVLLSRTGPHPAGAPTVGVSHGPPSRRICL